jgi:16S rRNA (uracil1498-N3)-methyltransferase
MRIDPLCPLPELLSHWSGAGAFFSTSPQLNPVHPRELSRTGDLLILIGPEGGWDPQEEQLMFQRGFVPASLGETILRTETAAIVATALCLLI